jgi:hypothetical protein
MAAVYPVTGTYRRPPEAAGADCAASAAASASVVLVSMAPAWLSGPGRHIGKIPRCTLIPSPVYQECSAWDSCLTETLSDNLRDGGHGCSSRDRRGSSPAGECVLAFCGLGAKEPSRSLRVG